MKFFHRFLSVSARNEKNWFLSYWQMQDKLIKVTQLFNYFNSSLCIILCANFSVQKCHKRRRRTMKRWRQREWKPWWTRRRKKLWRKKRHLRRRKSRKSKQGECTVKPVLWIRIICFWASRIRIRHYLYGSVSGSRSFHHQAKKKNLDFYCFVTFWLFNPEDWCKFTFKK